MKRNLLPVLGSLVMLASCSNSPSIDYVPFQSTKEGKWGMLGLDGEVLFEGEFVNQPTIPVNERFLVRDNNGHINIYTTEKKPRKIGDDYLAVGHFSQDITPAVKEGEHVKLIDREGHEVKTLDKIGNKKVVGVSNFVDNGTAVIVVEKDDKHQYGCINTSGNLTIEPKYDKIVVLGRGMDLVAGITNKGDSEKIEMLDLNGNLKFSLSSNKYDINETILQIELVFCNTTFAREDVNYIPIVKNDDEGKIGLIDRNGKEILKPTHSISGISYIAKNYFTFYKDGEWGIMSIKGEKLIRNKYEAIKPAGNDLFWAKSEGKTKLINLDDDEVGEERFEYSVLPFVNDKALVELDENEWGFVDKKCKEVKTKNLPDIYTVGLDDNNEYHFIWSDYVDIPAVVDAIQFTASGMCGWNINMTPYQATSNYLKQTGQTGNPAPSDYKYQYHLNFDKNVEKMDFSVSINFDGSLAEAQYDYDSYSYYYNTTYSWSSSKPEKIKLEITGERVSSNHQKLFSSIVDKLKTLGKLSKTNAGAAVVSMSNNTSFLVCHNSSSVEVIVTHLSPTSIDISPFADSNSNSRADQIITEPVEVVDSACGVIDSACAAED